jgi:hypothetical protein
MQELGTLKKGDLREIWPNESSDFTPWLEEHLRALGDVLGMDLELRQREAPVGGFSLDLLLRDVGQGRTVVVENQLSTTDHDHLGKLLTYASGYNAEVAIWLAKEIREEHRQALDWLNQRTDTNTAFFGVVVELLKFDGSRPAANFKLVAFPNEWRKANVGRSESAPSEREERYRSFFQSLIDELREQHSFTGARKAQPSSYYHFSSGFSNIHYGFSFARGNEARVELYIDRDKDWNQRLVDELQEATEASNRGLHQALKWEPLDTRNASRIAIYRPGSIDDDDETLDAIRDWAIEQLLTFKKIFSPKLSELVK